MKITLSWDQRNKLMPRMYFFLLSFFLPGMVSSHHAFNAFFDNNAIGIIQGELTEVSWVNPHVRLQIRTDQNEIWEAETAPVNSLQRLGLSEIVNVGDQIALAGALSRLGRKSMLAIVMTLPNGEEVVLEPRMNRQLRLSSSTYEPAEKNRGAGTSITAGTGEEQGIFRVWSRTGNNRNQNLPFSEAALAARALWDPITDDPALRCEAPGMPVTMDTPFPIEFVESGIQIILRVEQWDAMRVIHMDEPMITTNNQPSTLQGYSVGVWEGNTLVVETSNVSWPYFDEFGTPQTEAIRITERFMLSENQQTLTWQATMMDPVTFTEPAGLGTTHYKADPSEAIKPYNCDY
ncbi:MAG: DUF6152 family protein [Gammaproteobacteria bacterium]